MGKVSHFCGTMVNFFKNITVEPAYLMFAISQGLYIIVASELYISKVCKVNLAFGDEICDNIQQHKDEQVQVQKYVSTLKIYNSLLQVGEYTHSIYGYLQSLIFMCISFRQFPQLSSPCLLVPGLTKMEENS